MIRQVQRDRGQRHLLVRGPRKVSEGSEGTLGGLAVRLEAFLAGSGRWKGPKLVSSWAHRIST